MSICGGGGRSCGAGVELRTEYVVLWVVLDGALGLNHGGAVAHGDVVDRTYNLCLILYKGDIVDRTWHSRAQHTHGTARHGTARHGTARHSTAWHNIIQRSTETLWH